MTETPATHLARLKITWQSWDFRRDSEGFIAVHRRTRKRIVADTVPGLEARLLEWGTP